MLASPAHTKTGDKTVCILHSSASVAFLVVIPGGIAKLAISIARKTNALIFLVPEDIVDVRPRLVSRRCVRTMF